VIRRLRLVAAMPLEIVWAVEWMFCDRPPRSERLLRFVGGT
jgi:hypothetical protein